METDIFDKDYFTSGENDYGPDNPYDWEHRAGQMRVTMEDIEHLCLPFRSILDVGCATGLMVRAAVDKGYTAEGIDVSRWAVDNCDERASGLLHVGDATAIQFEDSKFDLVAAIDTLEHMMPGDGQKAMGEMMRVARHEIVLRLPCARLLEWGGQPEALATPTGDDSHKAVVPVDFWKWEIERRGWLIVCQMNAVELCMLPRVVYLVARDPAFQYESRNTEWEEDK